MLKLVPGVNDTNGWTDVFLWDRVTDTTTLVSHAAGSPNVPANRLSYGVQLSALDEKQRAAALGLLKSFTSEYGAKKCEAISNQTPNPGVCTEFLCRGPGRI